MRIFPTFPKGTEHICPICKTADDNPITLIGIHGTQEGNNQEALPVHLECINLQLHIGVVSDDQTSVYSMLMQVTEKVNIAKPDNSAAKVAEEVTRPAITYGHPVCPACNRESYQSIPLVEGSRYLCYCMRVVELTSPGSAKVVSEKCRNPVEGEHLICGVCGDYCGIVDAEFIEKWKSMAPKTKIYSYSVSEDKFLGYDRCEESKSWEY